MLRYLPIATIVIFATALPAAAQKPTDLIDQASYSIGVDIGRRLQADDLELNAQWVAQGLVSALSGQQAVLTDEEMEAALVAFNKAIQAKMDEKNRIAGANNKAEGEAFLAENAKKPNVKVTPSGLQYVVIKSGNGPSPTLQDQVTTHYHGMLIDGTVFDSSIERNQPATFPVSGVIRGWTEALQLMKQGDKWRLFIPSELAYGARGAGDDIGPNAVLVFDIELLQINGK